MRAIEDVFSEILGMRYSFILMISRCLSNLDSPIPIPDFDTLGVDCKPKSHRMRCRSQDAFRILSEDSTDPFQTISAMNLKDLLTDPSCHDFDRIVILDGRFRYEFRGGRISGARNVVTRAELAAVYDQFRGQNVLLVFHCEFSKNRGPTLMRMFRDYDRKMNARNYPELCYPNMFLLEGGYKNFYANYPELCIGGYVPMRDQRHVDNGELRRCHSEYARDMLQENPLPGKVRRRASSLAWLGGELFECESQVTQGSLLGKDLERSASPLF